MSAQSIARLARMHGHQPHEDVLQPAFKALAKRVAMIGQPAQSVEGDLFA